MSCQFEPKIQVESALALVKIVREGQLVEKRSEALQHVGCIVGSLGAFMGDSVDEDPKTFGIPLPETIEGCCEQLEQECSTIDSSASAFSPIIMLLIQRLIKLLIDELL